MSLTTMYRNAVTAHGCTQVIESSLNLVLDSLTDLTTNVLSESNVLAQAVEHAEEGYHRASEVASRLSRVVMMGEDAARGQERADDAEAISGWVSECVEHTEAVKEATERTLALIRQAVNDANTADDATAVQALDDSGIVTNAVRPNEFALLLDELVSNMSRNK